jgi:para-nitrobenzyl esterase
MGFPGGSQAYELVRKTVYGDVMGTTGSNSTLAWLGIPFAKPPVGDLRWKAPRDPDPWPLTRDARAECSVCTQYAMNFPFGAAKDMPPTITGSEDCLYLNVWRPKSDETNLPVLFWIHGGALTFCGNSWYDMTSFASMNNVIVVMPNYRLGLLGWFTHPALRAGESADDASGNYGTLDLIKALVWVKDNIQAFGGDPANVTIAGESAGGANVVSLLASPSAKGLFHKAIASSAVLLPYDVSEGDAAVNDALLQLLISDGHASDNATAAACLTAMSEAEIKDYLLSKTAADILATDTELAQRYQTSPARPIIPRLDTSFFKDGTVIPSAGLEVFTTGAYNKVPTILGNCKDEMKAFLYLTDYFSKSLEYTILGNTSVSYTPEEKKLYETASFYGSSFWKSQGVDMIAHNMSQYQSDVYAYRFDWGSDAPGNFLMGAHHGIDNRFLFDVNLRPYGRYNLRSPGAKMLKKISMDFISSFLRTGNPNTQASTRHTWSPWSQEEGKAKCILFNGNSLFPIITMSTEELTAEGIMQQMSEDVPEPDYSIIVKNIFTDYTMPAFLAELFK